MVTVTNNAKGPRGIYTAAGLVFLEAGETRTGLVVSEGELDGLASYFSVSDEAAAGITEGGENPPQFVAKHKGGGRWVILDVDREVAEGLTTEEAHSFNEMSDEDRAAYVAALEQAPDA